MSGLYLIAGIMLVVALIAGALYGLSRLQTYRKKHDL